MKKKKIVLTSIAIVLATVICVCSVFVVTVFNSASALYSNVEKKDENTLATVKDEIKILQLADLQFSTYVTGAMAFNAARKVIEKSNPDIIVLTGDNLTYLANRTHVNVLIDFMDEFKIPWAVVYGNHDHDALVSLEKQSELYENSEYCLFKKGNVKESLGNYYYNIERNDEIIYSLIFMNSNRHGFVKEQVEWYESAINEIKEDNGGNIVPSMLFFHIPIKEAKDAHDAYLKDESIGQGQNTEKVSVQTTDNKIFDKILELGSTNVLGYGHNHNNYTSINYKGVKFTYGVKTGKNSYHKRKIQGAAVYVIDKNNEVSVENIFI